MQMPPEIFILAFPKLRRSHIKAAQTMRKEELEALFLMFLRQLEEHVRMLAEGLDYSYVLAEMKKSKLIPEPTGAWEYYAEPILKIMSQIGKKNPNLKIHCFGDPFYESFSNETAVKLVILTFRALVTKKVKIEEWKKTLLDELNSNLEAFEEEAEFIADRTKKYQRAYCLYGLDGQKLKHRLSQKGMYTSLGYIDVPYYFTPLETLKNELMDELKGFPVSDDKIQKLIENHLNYVKKYLILSDGPDEAYSKWVNIEGKILDKLLEPKTVFKG